MCVRAKPKDSSNRLKTSDITGHRLETRVASNSPTSIHKNNETNDKFYRKVAFLMYTEIVNFTPQS